MQMCVNQRCWLKRDDGHVNMAIKIKMMHKVDEKWETKIWIITHLKSFSKSLRASTWEKDRKDKWRWCNLPMDCSIFTATQVCSSVFSDWKQVALPFLSTTQYAQISRFRIKISWQNLCRLRGYFKGWPAYQTEALNSLRLPQILCKRSTNSDQTPPPINLYNEQERLWDLKHCCGSCIYQDLEYTHVCFENEREYISPWREKP